MYVVYILKSETHNRYYTGHTVDLENRIKRHNNGYVRSTKFYRPWSVVYTENFLTKSDAYNREMQIKAYKHGDYFKKLIK